MSLAHIFQRSNIFVLKSRLHCLPANELIQTSPSATELSFLMAKATHLKSVDISGCDQITDVVFSDVWR